MAALFLNEFIENDVPWMHMDMSAIECSDGLGAANTNETGFGSLWLMDFLLSMNNQ